MLAIRMPRCLAAALLCAATLGLAAQSTAPATPATPHAAGAAAMPLTPGQPGYDRLLDVNRASKAQLQTLPGVTEAIAKKIIKGRPYLTKSKLVTRKVIPMDLYQKIRSLIKVVELPTK